ncbi:hypothetical protein Pan153_52360 [Gimesia panareensis]|uniref:Uncharacterized protein n=1 Tax=Gimesia panareensis TaxID=2527978 RepID=A0A518FW95_9PLAN|nr:hypothetical protein [Gimesia panareensis]QDV20560.1 hypothetical protein Pan153_52360 [Gimesia panareensis]
MSHKLAQELMDEFAIVTGLRGEAPPRRYLWTDAFALCNYLGLYHRTKDESYLQLSQDLIQQVHHTLGRHRPESPQQGWISGLTEAEGEEHPTLGGLRIGKQLDERAPDEPFDDRLEWDRDGQYFHYLTKWIHALNRAHQEFGQQQYLDWSIELAVVAHKAFTYERPLENSRRMYWKMSIDLSRPLVDSMGHHDPLDGLITSLELLSAVDRAGEQNEVLTYIIPDSQQMCAQGNWATEDPLGIGGLLDAAIRLLQADVSHRSELQALLIQLLREARLSLEYYSRLDQLDGLAERRLAFRELGLSLSLRGLELLSSAAKPDAATAGLIAGLLDYLPLADQIEAFWSEPRHRRADTWINHGDINSVMLATSLAPDGYFGM